MTLVSFFFDVVLCCALSAVLRVQQTNSRTKAFVVSVEGLESTVLYCIVIVVYVASLASLVCCLWGLLLFVVGHSFVYYRYVEHSTVSYEWASCYLRRRHCVGVKKFSKIAVYRFVVFSLAKMVSYH